ncbi:hypothetical protein RvY_18450 [Ramazzottius varieornatus]|uniref:Gamma-tubulin complex component n=1 Tax=Ramazzottius varieornatus TaxID=947166 RepID=A0A1D1WB92_RAMVA|nr:hypothetical protein RvY_18450 [Ramazzottius varieornatus]
MTAQLLEMHNATGDTAMPLMDLLCRLAGFGTSASAPQWSKFCHPHELEVLEHLLETGRARGSLKEYIARGDELGRKGRCMVASAVVAIKETVKSYDGAVVRMSGESQSKTPPTLLSIYAITSQYEAGLFSCLKYLKWLLDDDNLGNLTVGRMMDECHRRLESSNGDAKNAMENLFSGLFEAYKRTLIPWLVYGFLDSRSDDFFVKEPDNCNIYFREIGHHISSMAKAPSHMSAGLVEKIAQYGYMRKFLGWRSKNILPDPVLENQVVVCANRLRNLHWKNYRTNALSDIVDLFGVLYSHALYADIFFKFKIRDILSMFQQMYLMGIMTVFDEFVEQADDMLRGPVTPQTITDVNLKLDNAFDYTVFHRTFDPTLLRQDNRSSTAENLVDKGFSCFYFDLKSFSAVDNSSRLPSTDSQSAWDLLQLEFAVKHPLDWFFHKRTMDKYKQIFRFLLRLRRLTNAFASVWRLLREGLQSGLLASDVHLELFTWLFNFQHVMTTIQFYIQVDVIHAAWRRLTTQMDGLDDYIQLMEAHEAFLTQISVHAMMDNAMLHKCISALTKTSLEVCADISREMRKDEPEDVNVESARMKILGRLSSINLACLLSPIDDNAVSYVYRI